MTTTGQLELGIVQVQSSATGALIGYAFTEALEGGGQMQRWMLYQDPADAFTIAPPPATMAGWTLADWQKNLESLWKPGSFYVWAQATVYEHGKAYGDAPWTKIPDERSLPKAQYPVVPADFQLEPPRSQAVLELASDDGQPIALAYTVNGLHDRNNREYWMLPPGARAVGRGRRGRVRVGAAAAPTLQSYVDLANKQWGPGSVLVIVGCINYTGPTAPVGADAGAIAG